MKTETIRKNIKKVPEKNFLLIDDMQAVIDYCKQEGMTDYTLKMAGGALFDAINAAYALGYHRGELHQKRLNKKSLIHAENIDQRQR